MGITLASFQASGKVPRLRENIKKWEMGSVIGIEASFSSLLRMLSGPVAFDMSKPLRTLYRSMSDITFWLMRWLQYGGIYIQISHSEEYQTNKKCLCINWAFSSCI